MPGTISKLVWLESSWACFLNVIYLALMVAYPLFLLQQKQNHIKGQLKKNPHALSFLIANFSFCRQI